MLALSIFLIPDIAFQGGNIPYSGSKHFSCGVSLVNARRVSPPASRHRPYSCPSKSSSTTLRALLQTQTTVQTPTFLIQEPPLSTCPLPPKSTAAQSSPPQPSASRPTRRQTTWAPSKNPSSSSRSSPTRAASPPGAALTPQATIFTPPRTRLCLAGARCWLTRTSASRALLEHVSLAPLPPLSAAALEN